MSRGALYRKLMGESRLTRELRVQRRRIFYGALLWIVGTPLLAVLLGASPFFSAIAVGSWIVLLCLMLRYFYFLFFKKDK